MLETLTERMKRTRQSDVVFEPVMVSPAMRRVDKILRTVAPRDVTLAFIGESGSGKEILARRAHELSERRQGPFIPINCAAIPEALFESELFGHERGAFTGATERARGKVEAASAGTLFLDEIGEMPLSLQTKLLRFLESRAFMRVGGTTKIRANIRLLVATLRPLEQEVRAGRFRADLFYRIQGITINVPPLRERKADIPPLIAQFMARLSADHGVEPPRLTREARAALLRYEWPGNVRELQNVIAAACLLRSGKVVRMRDLPEAIQRAGGHAEPSGTTEITVSLEHPLAEIIDQVIEAALSLEQGSQTRAAARLGVSVRTIQRHLGKRPH
jgi:transcriptional regulator with PAS, ATPase and Fis domain